MSDNSATIVSKVWNYAHVLKNAGVGYGDYFAQITYLLFGSAFGLRAAPKPTVCLFPLRSQSQARRRDDRAGINF